MCVVVVVCVCVERCAGTKSIAPFPGPAQLFIVCSKEKRGEPDMFQHASIMQ